MEKLYICIRPDKFYFLKFILEGYDGIAMLSSSGIRKEIVLIRYPREQRKDIFSLLSSLAPKISPSYNF